MAWSARQPSSEALDPEGVECPEVVEARSELECREDVPLEVDVPEDVGLTCADLARTGEHRTQRPGMTEHQHPGCPGITHSDPSQAFTKGAGADDASASSVIIRREVSNAAIPPR